MSIVDNVVRPSADGWIRDPASGEMMSDVPIWDDTDTWMKRVVRAGEYAGKRMAGVQDLAVSQQMVEDHLFTVEKARLNKAMANINKLIANEERKTGKDAPPWMYERRSELQALGKDLENTGLREAHVQQYVTPTVRRLRRATLQQKLDAVEHDPQFD